MKNKFIYFKITFGKWESKPLFIDGDEYDAGNILDNIGIIPVNKAGISKEFKEFTNTK